MALIDEYTPKSGRYIDDNSVVSNVVEETTGAWKGIDSDHSYIHEGRLYESFVKTTLAATNGEYNIAFVTPSDDGYAHYRPSSIVSSADMLTLQFYEGATCTGGTALAAINHNRAHSREAGNTLAEGVTVTDDGDLLAQIYIPGSAGIGGTRYGSQFGPAVNEWVLKRNTCYLIRMKNESTSENTVQINFFWYEEEQGVIT